MNPAWWAVIIAGFVAVTGWAGVVVRLLWSGRGLLDQINNSHQKLDQHLAWHWQEGNGHALFDESRRRKRQPRQQADRQPVDRPDLLRVAHLR